MHTDMALTKMQFKTLDGIRVTGDHDLVYASLLRKSGIPKRYYNMNFEDYSEEWLSENKENLQKMQHFIDNFGDLYSPRGEGLLFAGPPGSGKTLGACTIGKELILQGHSVYYSTIHDLVQMSFRAIKDHDLRRWMKDVIVRGTDLLIVDELDAYYSPETGIVDSFITQLFGERYNDLGSMILITNTIEDLRLGDWIIDRIREVSYQLVFSGDSHRGKIAKERSCDESHH